MFRVVYASFGVLEQAFIREINLYFSKYSIVYMNLSSISPAVLMLELLTKSAIQHRSDGRSRFSYFICWK